MLGPWLHVLSLTVYLGSVAWLCLLLPSSLRAIEPEESRREFLLRALRLYGPVQIAALGLVVLSGAFGVTEIKAAYRGTFAQAVGATLALKLILSFILILLSTYQSMGIAHRFVRRHEGGEKASGPEIDAVIGRLRATSAAIFLLAAPILWLGLRL